MMKIFAFILTLIVFMYFACSPEKPVNTDSGFTVTFMVTDTTGLYLGADTSGITPIEGAEVVLNSKEYVKQYRQFTDENGKAVFTDLIASTYEVNTSYQAETGIMFLGGMSKEIFEQTSHIDTIRTKVVSATPLVLNEIYYAGPQNNLYFFYDQFIELFNGSDSIIYLDGKIIGRCRVTSDFRPMKDTVDYVPTTYAYQFTGEPGGKNWPIMPGQRVAIATDAYDHSQTVNGAVNLENADFEFYNEYAGDWDNPDVPNLVNINPTRGPEFYISLGSDAVVLADGTDWDLVTVATEHGDRIYCHLAINSIIDGVEYKSSSSYDKGLTYRVDAGYAGVGLTKYSGKSIQRINPYQDTDNSSIDFEILDTPTPGN